ncbi:sugar transferase [Echinimonas agarilytica]|uniref:sugar transferase n=1 Tax=Echinimonas agarilytica TaxID=1215918 RepID=UPI0025580895|nr:sugar transferase [Echinimonas agarilytica]
MTTSIAVITLLAMFLVVYHHALYPIVLRLWSAKPKAASKSNSAPIVRHFSQTENDQDLPFIDLIIPAYNEAEFVAAKLMMISALDYPSNKIRVRLVCDGCTDDTAEIARQTLQSMHFCDVDIQVVEHLKNRGKVAVLNEAIGQSEADVVALSDVSALISVDAMLIAASHFENHSVGVVCGHYQLLNPGSEGEQKYWQYQRKVRENEANLGALLGAHGAFYLIRRQAFVPLREDTINDDFVLPMNIMANGYRAVHEPDICAVELEQANDDLDRARRKRIGAGNLQQVVRLRHMMLPRFKGQAFAFFSGKALRVAVPLLLIVSAFGSAYLAFESLMFGVLLGLQLAGYSLALLPRVFPSISFPNVMKTLNYLIEGHAACFYGSLEYVVYRFKREYFDGYRDPLITLSKRIQDIILSLVMLIVTAPVMILVAIAIRVDSSGPVFYRQLRVGKMTHQRTELIYVIKFRSMQQHAELNSGAVWATHNDPRITRVGRFLRCTRLDELPQFFNVLRGDMSVVGPRPERPEFYGKLERAIPFFKERTFGLKPGITGLAQVSQGYDGCIEDVRNKAAFDHSYALSLSRYSYWIFLEWSILFKTAAVVFLRKGQ